MDEEGTHAQLQDHLRLLVDPKIAEYRGRVVKNTGDGMLAEFTSVVNAMRCAVDIQRSMAERNADVPHEKRIEFRIGINVGDIIIDRGDIFGDGVNVAARLEGIAEPGGICVSRRVFEDVQGKLDTSFEDAGEHQLKNIVRPVSVYKANLRATISTTRPALMLPDKPSIVVVPFQNMSGDPEQDYFADGMVEKIITALSRFRSLSVVGSSSAYKRRAVDTKTIGRELGVRYVLEGSVRKAGRRVRIAAQLVEAATERHLWADHFDGALEDVFSLQDQVTMSVVGLITPKLEQAEIERARQKPTDKLDSYDFYLRGIALATKRKTLPESREFFRKAFERDPEYAAAYAMAAWTLLAQQVTGGLPLTAEMRADAIQLAHLGARSANADAFTLARCGHALTYFEHEYDRGLSMVEQAVALNPNLAVAWYSRGWVTLMCGDAERAIESFDQMIRLSPLDPQRISAWLGTSWALFCLERFEEGCAFANKAIQVSADANILAAYIANSASAGRAAEARQAAGRLLKLQPDFRAPYGREVLPSRSPKVRELIVAAFRTAGLPD
jgi:TolB-like protein